MKITVYTVYTVLVIIGLSMCWAFYKVQTTSSIKIGTKWELYKNIYDSYSLKCNSKSDVHPFQVKEIIVYDKYFFVKTVSESSYFEDIVYCSLNKCGRTEVLRNEVFIIKSDSIDVNKLDFMNVRSFFYQCAIFD